MDKQYFFLIAMFVLMFFIASQPATVHKIKFLDSNNVSVVERISPEFDKNGLVKPFYERLFDFMIRGPAFLIPSYPWLGYIILYGGAYFLWFKMDVMLEFWRRNYGKKG